MRFLPLALAFLLTLGGLVLWSRGHVVAGVTLAGLFGALALLGVRDVVQRRHSVLRNYPLIGHIRWLMEAIRPELRQYLFASDQDDGPFNRAQRSLVYQRSKDEEDNQPFGTRLDLYEEGSAWLTHSIVPAPENHDPDFRVRVGGPACGRPYDLSLMNVSAMSFGSLSGPALQALNRGARLGGFAQDTGEGGISRYHRIEGGDLIWEIGSGYFGCRTTEGRFNPDRFAEQAADDQVKMIEVKISQGAKPGHGGVLPGAKVTAEIAEARGVQVGQDCISPAAHPAFGTPLELVGFLDQLRQLSGGKPVGFKLCIGHDWEFMAIVKAMRETGICPDFIVVDGAEGGTGAAPAEFSDHLGMPLSEGLPFVHNVLVGAGLRDQIRIGAAGKVVSAFDVVRALSLGADWVNAARAFMFSVGCIQSLSCHTNRCPVGVATQDPRRTRALDVADKGRRVARFHANTLQAVADLISAAGFASPADIPRGLVWRRDPDGRAVTRNDRTVWLPPGGLLDAEGDEAALPASYVRAWSRAQAETFAPAD